MRKVELGKPTENKAGSLCKIHYVHFCHHLLLKDREQYFIQLILEWAFLTLVAKVLKASHGGCLL